MPKELLSAKRVDQARPKDKPYRLLDGGGLTLYVATSGVRSWQYRYTLAGKQQTATLGRYPELTLAEARKRADAARGMAQDGVHVTVAKRVAKAKRIAATAGTFAAVAKEWVKRQARNQGWTDDYKAEVEGSLRNHLSALNELPLGEIDATIATPLVERVQAKAPDMARKVEQRLHGILDYGVRRGLLRMNPLPRPERHRRKDRRNYPAILERKAIGDVLRDAEQLQLVSTGVRRAHLLTVFAAQRIGEIVPARWTEIDFATATWTIPRTRMKRRDPERGDHVVPLPPRLLALLTEWRRADGDDGDYVCPAPSGTGHITREAVEKFYRRTLELANRHSPHSWRSVFSTWSRDAGKDHDAIESQLDHGIGSKVQSAYDRAKRLERRRELMAWYEATVLAARDGAEVLRLPREPVPA